MYRYAESALAQADVYPLVTHIFERLTVCILITTMWETMYLWKVEFVHSMYVYVIICVMVSLHMPLNFIKPVIRGRDGEANHITTYFIDFNIIIF